MAAKDISALIIFSIFVLLIVALLLHPILLYGFDVGLPNDSRLLCLEFVTEGASGVHVYGTGYEVSTDRYSNNIIIVQNPYEARLFHWANTAKQKSLKGVLTGATYFRDPYYIPILEGK
jgi:hypothetical protein